MSKIVRGTKMHISGPNRAPATMSLSAAHNGTWQHLKRLQ
eukprot:jgi/Botrbrau1/9774/Bobra.85_1s0019.1